MKTIYIATVMTIVVLFSACKQDQYQLFNDVSRLQFGPEPHQIYSSTFNLADTLQRYTFVYEDEAIVQDTAFFNLYALGGKSNVDRPFRLEQILQEGVDNAVSGVHYKSFDHEELRSTYLIPANSVHKRIPIILLRDPSLKTKNVVLKFKVVANEYFEEGEVSNLWRKVEFTDKLSQPARWNNEVTQYYLGKYSLEKHQFMIDVTGQLWDQDFFVYLFSNYAFLNYWRGKVKLSLDQYNTIHKDNPLRDENKELVVFP